MGKLSTVSKAILEAGKAAELPAKEARAGFGAAGLKAEADAAKAAKAEADRLAAIEAGQKRAGTVGGRIGVSQRELDALKSQTIRRSGEEGWRGLTGEMRARLEEGGQFPLRTSITPRTGGGGPVAPLSYEMGKPVPVTEPVRAHIARTQGEDVAELAMSKKNRGTVMGSVRETVASRATGQEMRLREIASGIQTPTRGAEARTAREAAREAVETGTSRGVGSVAQGVAPERQVRPNLSDIEKLRRGIQSGAVRAAAVGGAGYAAQGWGDTARDLDTGPDNSHRTPTVQWGRNRQ